MLEKIQKIQRLLNEYDLDGWLIYDFQKRNILAWNLLEIPTHTHASRRFFYWIPKQGSPCKIIHRIEPHLLTRLPGKVLYYQKWQELEAQLQNVVRGSKHIAMEYSPRGEVPYISLVDAGTHELIESFRVEIVSSAKLLIECTCRMTASQLESHYEAARVLDSIAADTWDKIQCQKSILSEWDIQQFILQEITSRGFITDHPPICAVNSNTANPHFFPVKDEGLLIQKDSLILIDLWCKKNKEQSIYADITRMAYKGSAISDEIKNVFSAVRNAQKIAVEFIRKKIESSQPLLGYEVDEVARKSIEKAGFGDFFIHRTGHNIFEDLHGPGAHFDSYETLDTRPIMPLTCYSVEPGVYIPGKFGIRLEHDIVIFESKVQITGGEQDNLIII